MKKRISIPKSVPIFELIEIYKTFNAFQMQYGINITEASRQNFEARKTALKRGFAYLNEYLLESSSRKELPTEELNLKGTFLSPEEVLMFEFIIENFTFKHATESLSTIRTDGNRMMAVRTRREAGSANTDNAHSARLGGDDGHIFFVGGLGNHQTPKFLEGDNDIITIPAKDYLERHEHAKRYAWCNGHLTSYYHQEKSRKYCLGDCEFTYRHFFPDFTKTYCYTHKDGRRYERTVKLSETIFLGGELLSGIAYDFILHLRFLMGGSYRKHIYDTLLNSDLTHERKIAIISAGMSVLMPGWVYPEIKIPHHVNINDPAVTITSSLPQETREARKKMNASTEGMLWRYDIDEKLKREPCSAKDAFECEIVLKLAAEYLALDILRYYLDGNNMPPTITGGEFPLIYDALEKGAPYDAYHDVLQYLFSKGFDPNTATPLDGTAIHLAIKRKDPRLINLLTTTPITHMNDPMISFLADINHDRNGLVPGLLEAVCETGDEETLKKFINLGGDVRRQSSFLINAAARHGHIHLLPILKEHGADFSVTEKHHETAAMVFAEKDNPEGIRLVHQYGVDLNVQLDSVFSSRRGYTALHFAVKNNAQKAADKLLRLGADPNLRSDDGMTPLELAKSLEFTELETLLLKTTSSLTKNEFEKCTRKHFSIAVIVTGIDRDGQPATLLGKKRNRQNQIIGKLFFPGGFVARNEKPIDAAIREFKEETGIDLEAYRDRARFVYQFERPAYETHYNICFIHFDLKTDLSQKGFQANDDLARLYLIKLHDIANDSSQNYANRYSVIQTNGPTFIKGSNGILLQAIQGNFDLKENSDALDEVIGYENYGKLQLAEAVEVDDPKTTQRIIDHRVSIAFEPNNEFSTLLAMACDAEHYEIARILMKAGLSISDGYPNSCYYIVRNGNLDFLKEVFAQHELTQDILAHALNAAILFKKDDIFTYLLSIDSLDVNYRLPREQYPLSQVAKEGHLDYVKQLIDKGALIEPKEIGFINHTIVRTPLHNAIFHDHLDVVRFLIEKGASLNRGNKLTSKDRWNSLLMKNREEEYRNLDALSLAMCYEKFNIVLYLLSLPTCDITTLDKEVISHYVGISLKHIKNNDEKQALSIIAKRYLLTTLKNHCAPSQTHDLELRVLYVQENNRNYYYDVQLTADNERDLKKYLSISDKSIEYDSDAKLFVLSIDWEKADQFFKEPKVHCFHVYLFSNLITQFAKENNEIVEVKPEAHSLPGNTFC